MINWYYVLKKCPVPLDKKCERVGRAHALTHPSVFVLQFDQGLVEFRNDSELATVNQTAKFDG